MPNIVKKKKLNEKLFSFAPPLLYIYCALVFSCSFFLFILSEFRTAKDTYHIGGSKRGKISIDGDEKEATYTT